mmetsp:Transcript_43561/g.137341  ORF Transcript_43561/g.137341 Transcript_43561/m.137341 type:complete len:295 (+) Transcript_43561:115-999(+)
MERAPLRAKDVLDLLAALSGIDAPVAFAGDEQDWRSDLVERGSVEGARLLLQQPRNVVGKEVAVLSAVDLLAVAHHRALHEAVREQVAWAAANHSVEGADFAELCSRPPGVDATRLRSHAALEAVVHRLREGWRDHRKLTDVRRVRVKELHCNPTAEAVPTQVQVRAAVVVAQQPHRFGECHCVLKNGITAGVSPVKVLDVGLVKGQLHDHHSPRRRRPQLPRKIRHDQGGRSREAGDDEENPLVAATGGRDPLQKVRPHCPAVAGRAHAHGPPDEAGAAKFERFEATDCRTGD